MTVCRDGLDSLVIHHRAVLQVKMSHAGHERCNLNHGFGRQLTQRGGTHGEGTDKQTRQDKTKQQQNNNNTWANDPRRRTSRDGQDMMISGRFHALMRVQPVRSRWVMRGLVFSPNGDDVDGMPLLSMRAIVKNKTKGNGEHPLRNPGMC